MSLILIAGTFRPKNGLVKDSDCEIAFLSLVKKSEHHAVVFEMVNEAAETRHAHFIVSVPSSDKPTLNFGKVLRNICTKKSPDSKPTVAVNLKRLYKGECGVDGQKYDSYVQYMQKDGPLAIQTSIFENEEWRDLAHDDIPVDERRANIAWGEMNAFCEKVTAGEYDIDSVSCMERAYMDMVYVTRTWQPKKSMAERKLFITDAYLYHRRSMTSCDEINTLVKVLGPSNDQFDDMRRGHADNARRAKKQKVCVNCVDLPRSDLCEECQ